MTRQPMPPDEPSRPAEPSGTAPAAFLDGLALDRLHRSGVMTFLRGLSRRAARQLGVEPADADQAGTQATSPVDTVTVDSDSDSDIDSDIDDDRIDRMQRAVSSMTDRLDALIERMQATGYPLNPSGRGDAEPSSSLSLPPVLRPTWERFAAAATEAVRWGDGIPADAWIDNDLMEHARASVGELSWLLRRLEEESPSSTDSSAADETFGLGSDATG